MANRCAGSGSYKRDRERVPTRSDYEKRSGSYERDRERVPTRSDYRKVVNMKGTGNVV